MLDYEVVMDDTLLKEGDIYMHFLTRNKYRLSYMGNDSYGGLYWAVINHDKNPNYKIHTGIIYESELKDETLFIQVG